MAHLSNRRRKEIGKLSRRKYRRELGQTLIEGTRAVRSALEAGAPLIDILIDPNEMRDEALLARIRETDLPVYEVDADELRSFSQVDTSQGVIAVAKRHIRQIEELAAYDSVLVLDGVQDPGNVGTLLRTAAWFGVEAVVGLQGTAGFFHPKVMRAGMGAHWDLLLGRGSNVGEVVASLKTHGVKFVGADLDGTSLKQWRPAKKVALFMGSEAHGLSAESMQALDERISIRGNASKRAGTESLNVAISAGIIMHSWLAK